MKYKMDNSRGLQEVTIIHIICPNVTFKMVNMKGSPLCHWSTIYLLKQNIRNKIQQKAFILQALLGLSCPVD